MNKGILVILLCLVFIVVISGTALATPNGANYTGEVSTTAPTDPPQDHSAIAGNVTEIIVTGFSTTQSWQGYFGNVSGTIQLADSNDNVMYNWSQVNAEGEIYAANYSSVSWSNIECFNFTSNSSYNLTQIESDYNIISDDKDGVDETFYLNDHAAFSVGTISFSLGECNNTKLFNDAGTETFDEVLLYDNSTQIPVFASILTDDTTGFDGDTHDFEMLVIEDGHDGDSNTMTYYFYVELNA